MAVLWSEIGDYGSRLQHVDRINPGNSVQVCRSAADHFFWFYIPLRYFGCTRLDSFTDGGHDRGVRGTSAVRLYLRGAFQVCRNARPCRQAMVIAGKSEALIEKL